jgi:hypothetical protein
MMRATMGNGMLRRIPIEVWIDHAGRLRAEVVSITTPKLSETLRLTMVGYGVPVNVLAPPPSSVFKLPANASTSTGSGSAPA